MEMGRKQARMGRGYLQTTRFSCKMGWCLKQGRRCSECHICGEIENELFKNKLIIAMMASQSISTVSNLVHEYYTLLYPSLHTEGKCIG